MNKYGLWALATNLYLALSLLLITDINLGYFIIYVPVALSVSICYFFNDGSGKTKPVQSITDTLKN